MKCEQENPISLYEALYAVLNNDRQSGNDLAEENSMLLVKMPPKETQPQFNDCPVVVRGGMHQTVEEFDHGFMMAGSTAQKQGEAVGGGSNNMFGDGI